MKLKPKVKKVSKSERLIYIIIFLWVVFGVLGIYFQSNLAQLAGYYASLTLFTATYLWGEFKRGSKSSHFFKKGGSSSREIVIHVTIWLWAIFGILGIIFAADINQLTVYFAALTPFVSSYLIYKTSKGKDLPIFDGKSQELVDKNINTADNTKVNQVVDKVEEHIETSEVSKEDEVITPSEQTNDNEDETDF